MNKLTLKLFWLAVCENMYKHNIVKYNKTVAMNSQTITLFKAYRLTV